MSGRTVGRSIGVVFGMFASAVCAGPVADVSRVVVQFSNTGSYVNIVQPVFLTNVGDGPLTITALTLGGLNPGDFRIKGTCTPPMVLAANGGRCRIDIESNLGSGRPAGRSAVLSLSSNASPAIPDISMSAIVDDVIARSFVTPGWIDFPPQPIGTPATAQSVTFTNIVSAAVHVDAITFYGGDAGDFSSATSCVTLAPGQACSIALGFAPAAAGPRSTELEVDYTAADGGSRHVRRFSLTGVGGAGSLALTATAVEYYYQAWDYYFVTSFRDEIAILDGGAFGGVWKRTGQTFQVWTDASSGGLPTCRFFSTGFAPKSSHFYSPNAAECTGLKSNPDWQYESIAYYLQLPDAAGACSAGTTVLYRLYNQGMGGAPNHRFTTDHTTFQQMQTAGWQFEGNGNTGAFACVPQ